nr:threonine/serine dehydratase [Oceanibacterium hippocampi]
MNGSEPEFADIRRAADRLDGLAVRTPLLESPLLNERLGGRLLVKAEPLQRTGSFKFRGAYNCLQAMLETDPPKAVIAYSSGNHAQGVAAAAGLAGVAATIVMPSDAPALKRANTAAYGARVVLYDRANEDREAIAEALRRETGATLIRPYDDPNIIAGQGTVGLEIAQQCREAGIRPDAVLVPCGGGGLVSGTALALHGEWPDLPIHAVEPDGFDDTRRSLIEGIRVRNAAMTGSICDALLSPMPGELTFAINARELAGGIAVSDDDVRGAMRAAVENFKLTIEPGGAVAVAAVLSGHLDCRGRTVVVVASGGNVDLAAFAAELAPATP